MIKQLCIHNFKIHRDSVIDMAPLTILTGANSSGKSSVFQGLLMLRETVLETHKTERLMLKGHTFDVGGRANGLVCWGIDTDPQTLRFDIVDDNDGKLTFEYSYPEDALGNPDVLKAKPGTAALEEETLAERLPLFSSRFQYLSAFRFGPQMFYGEDTTAAEQNQVSSRMGQGEYAVMLLNKLQMNDIGIAELQHPEESSLLLIDQVQAWMNEITDGVKVKIEGHGDKCLLQFGYAAHGTVNRYASAMNSGYGVAYVFSVVVALLVSVPNSLVIIENPEAHIHPAAQAAVMRLVAQAAAHGVQVLIETHSDHIINAALVDLKRGVLKRGELAVHYFTRDPHSLTALPIQLTIGPDSRIKKAPAGFFDQMKSDLEVLFDLDSHE